MATKATKTEKQISAEFSVIETGGKQYIVSVGDVIDVELLGGDLKEGDKVTFDTVLLTDNGSAMKVGAPHVAGAKVSATYMGESKGKKITILRYKQKSNRDRKIGHRQHYATVKIDSI